MWWPRPGLSRRVSRGFGPALGHRSKLDAAGAVRYLGDEGPQHPSSTQMLRRPDDAQHRADVPRVVLDSVSGGAARGAGRYDSRYHLRQRGARAGQRIGDGRGDRTPRGLGDRGCLRDPGRSRWHVHGESATDRLPLAVGRGHRAASRQSDSGFHPVAEPGPARADRRRSGLPGPAHGRGGAGRPGGHLPRGGAPATGEHRDQHHPPVGRRLRSTSRGRASPTPATSSGRSRFAA